MYPIKQKEAKLKQKKRQKSVNSPAFIILISVKK